jgi:UDP-hydrolysing UDP-N-acetyl-D-glucosamine 2-epimerase
MGSNKKKYLVAYITGTRAEFGYWKRSLLSLQENPEIDVYVIATSMHTIEGYGSTLEQVRESGLRIKEIHDGNNGASLASLAASIGKNMSEMAKIFSEERPDLLMVSGDRGEQLAGALAAAYLNIPVVHHGGGNTTGSIDNKVRNAISAIADYHLPSNKLLGENLEKSGVEKTRIFNIGGPVPDEIALGNFTTPEKMREKYHISADQPSLVLLFHPNTDEHGKEETYLTEILSALSELGYRTIAIGANADGGRVINERLKEFAAEHSFMSFYASVPREDYLGFLGVADVLVGNSSSGFSELPSFKKPYVCLGHRQEGRFGETRHILFTPIEKGEILNAIKKVLSPGFKESLKDLKNPYGDGDFYKKLPPLILNLLSQNESIRNT